MATARSRRWLPALPLAAIVFAVMLATLTYAFGAGDLGDEGSRLLAMPWGLTTLVDVYAGIALFSGWIVYRERSRMVMALWIAAICAAGNLASALYVLWAAHRAQGDERVFWSGPARIAAEKAAT